MNTVANGLLSAVLGVNAFGSMLFLPAGPTAETRPLQRILISVIFIAFPASFVIGGLDHRFGWSLIPAPVSVVGDVLVAVGLGLAMLVIIQNSYAAANVRVESGQQLVSSRS